MKKCPNCSLVHDDSVMKCTYCGYDFTENDEVITDAVDTPIEVDAEVVESAPQVEPAQEPVPVAEPVQNNYNAYGAPQAKYCPRCGNQCDPKAVICVKCGFAFENIQNIEDKPSTGLKILCFLFPIVGLILYLVNKGKKPVSAKEYGKWALIGFIVGIVWNIISSILSGFIYGSVYDDYDYYYTMVLNALTMFK